MDHVGRVQLRVKAILNPHGHTSLVHLNAASYPLCSTAFEMYRMADHFVPMAVYSDCQLVDIRQLSTQLSLWLTLLHMIEHAM